MNIRTTLITTGLIAASLVSGAAQAALQGRDLNGSAGSFEAYYDTVLDITWLADANYAKTSGYNYDGKMTWADANTWAANLSFTDAVNNITYADWRLPTVNPVNGVSFNYGVSYNGSTDIGFNITSPQSEMGHLYYVTLGNLGAVTPAGAQSGCYVGYWDTCLENVGPFINLQANRYWLAPEYTPNTYYGMEFGMDAGAQAANGKFAGQYALAVSPGDVAAVPEAETYALMLAGLGLIGWRARRRG